jgi:hypothetical protein
MKPGINAMNNPKSNPLIEVAESSPVDFLWLITGD